MSPMFRCFSIVALALLLSASPAAADEPSPLDAELLKDLDSDLLEGLGDDLGDLAPPPTKPTSSDVEEPPVRLDEQKLLDDVIGEDVGAADVAGDDANPLVRIEQKMRQVQERLAQRDPSGSTQTLQRQIADELAALLEQLRQQQQQNQNQNSSSQQQQQQSSSKSQSEQQKSSSASNQPAGKPAEDSEERLGKVDEERIRPEDLRELFQRAWGHLPPQVRQQMQAAAEEQFLPKYELLIEEYYKRLAEETR
ncbi:MAG: hypothetical protein KY475_10000 [Planctomycetes bacterium]|nr:hypothetical protein [Planctomycetota bacterium]